MVTAYAAATEVTAAAGAEAEGGEGEPLEVSVRLLDDGALVRWRRARGDVTRCTLRWYEGAPPGERLLATAHTHHDYMLGWYRVKSTLLSSACSPLASPLPFCEVSLKRYH